MDIDFDYFSLVLSGVARAITDDQMILEHQVTSSPTMIDSILVSRNRYNTNILSQLVNIGRNASDLKIQTVGLLEVLESVTKGFDQDQVRASINRTRPLVNILSDQKILITILKIIFCLMKVENLNNKNFSLNLRRREGYVSLRIEAAEIKSEPGYLEDVVGFINLILLPLGGSVRWLSKFSHRIVFIKFHLSSQMALRYNGSV